MAMSADVQVKSTNDEKLSTYFLLCLSRFDLDMYWRHLKVWDGTVRIHSMFLSRAPGYCNFKVNFQGLSAQDSTVSLHVQLKNCTKINGTD